MKRSTAIILTLLLVGFGLRVWNLSTQSIWWDEAFTWQTTSHGLANLWQMLLTGDRNPPLYFVSVAAWGSLAGWSEFSLRFVSVAWSMVGLAVLFNLAKRLYNTSAGLYTFALAAVAPALVVYAQEARMYAAFFALTAATLYFAWRIYERGNQQSAFNDQKLTWAFVLCEAGLLLTHYFAIPLVVTLNIFALIILFRRRAQVASYAKWIAGQALVALPIVIWTLMVYTTPGSLTRPAEMPPAVFEAARQAVTLWLTGVRELSGRWDPLVILAAMLLPPILLGSWQINARVTRWVISFWCLSLLLAFFMVRVLTSFHPRYMLPYSLPWLVLVGGALSGLLRRVPRATTAPWIRITRYLAGGYALALIFLWLAEGWGAAASPAYAKDDARQVAAYLKQHTQAEDMILLEANDYTLNYYDHGPAQTKMISATTEAEALPQLSAAMSGTKRVWLPHWTVSTQDPHGYWPFLLEQSGNLKDWTSYRGYELSQYDMRTTLQAPSFEVPVVDKTGLMIGEWTGLEELGQDGVLTFAIKWQPNDKWQENSKISLRLIDPAGVQSASADEWVLGKDNTTSAQSLVNYFVLAIPPGTPPVTYTLRVQPYEEHELMYRTPPFDLGVVHLPRRLDTSDPYRTLAGYNWQNPANPHIASGLTLDSFALSSQKPRQPMPIDVTLRWRKTGEVSDAAPRLRLAQAGRVWNEIGSDLLEHEYPIGQWVEGETVIDRLTIDYPPVRGPVELQVGQGDHWTTLTTLQLDESRLMLTPPPMQHQQSAQFGDFAELVGYDLQKDSFSATRPLYLELYWRGLNTEPITTPFTVFTQVLAPDGHLVAQNDAPPDPPTTQWVPGQIVPDSHSIKVVDPAYHGPATLIVGWYNSASVERVPVQGGGDHIVLQAPVRVENP